MSSISSPSVRGAQAAPGQGIGLYLAIGCLVAVLGFALPFVGLPKNLLALLTSASISAILATAVGFLVRQAGLSSFGHAAFYGGAAYAIALLVKYTSLPAEVVVLAAPLLIVGLGVVVSLILLRTNGIAFSMLSLAMAQAVYELVMKWRDLANGEDGLRIRFAREIFGLKLSFFQKADTMFLVTWAVLVVVIAILVLVSRSNFGTLTIAIKNNEERARFLGYRTLWPRVVILALSALIAALGGTLFALYNGYVTPSLLHWTLSGEALIIAIIGGTRSVWAPAVGAFVFVILRDVAGNYTTHWQSIVGLVLIAVVLTLPNGIGGALTAFTNRFGGRQNG
ncbi:MAG: branched-chain amino acid ABC transporter permease [Candidatus Kaistia colombiensis]|nr:MAG: branched-chain amino acid ABC transporter permease [Kaistia sp.]